MVEWGRFRAPLAVSSRSLAPIPPPTIITFRHVSSQAYFSYLITRLKYPLPLPSPPLLSYPPKAGKTALDENSNGNSCAVRTVTVQAAAFRQQAKSSSGGEQSPRLGGFSDYSNFG